jgi:hypothetical protein
MAVSESLIAVAHALATDRATAEVVAALRDDGIEPVLLKGASLLEWLYASDGRPYSDADLLVDPDHVMQAAAVLARLGFEPVPHHVSKHAHPWLRPADGTAIDLHVTIYGSLRSPIGVWRELQGWLVSGQVAGERVQMLNLAGRALMVAIHAAQHPELARPRADLARALRVPREPVWTQAEQLADRLRVLATMASGLRLDPDGERLLESLPCVRAAELFTPEQAPLAIGFARLRKAAGWRARARVLAQAVLPPTDELRVRHANVDGRFGLALAYIRHAVWLIYSGPVTALALWRQRRR